jgi:hypothetical protein
LSSNNETKQDDPVKLAIAGGYRIGVLGVCVGSRQGVALVLENPKAA